MRSGPLSLVSRLRPVGTLPFRAADFAGTRASRLGERRGQDWLLYNPLTMWSYHRLARRDADAVMDAIHRVFPDVADALDVGAGSGAFAAAGRRLGIRVRALERSRAGRLLATAQRVPAQPFDLRARAGTAERAQLAYCFEVAEHLDPALGDELVAFLAFAAPTVVFTAAHPGQGGYGHINEQPRGYWVERFRAAGMQPWPEAVDALARAFAQNGVEGPWFVENLLVLRAAPELAVRVPPHRHV